MERLNPMRMPFEFIQNLRENFKGHWLYVSPDGLIVAYDDPEKLMIDLSRMVGKEVLEKPKE